MKTKRRKVALLLGGFLWMGTGCVQPKQVIVGTKQNDTTVVGPEVRGETDNVPKSSHQATSLSDAIVHFGSSVLQGLRKTDQGNIVISPVSLHMALSILENGANQQTKSDLRFGLWTQSFAENVNTEYGLLQKLWNQSNAKTALVSANALWYVGQNKPIASFVQSIAPYQAFLEELRGTPEQKAEQINYFIDQKTNHTIPKLVTPTSMSNVKFALTNAVYFQGLWVYPFIKIVDPLLFTKEDGSSISKVFMKRKADFVYQQGGFGFAANVSYQAIRIPYGEEGKSKLSMLVIVPKIDKIDRFLERLFSTNHNVVPGAKNNWSQIIDSMYLDSAQKESVELTMPLLKLDYTASSLDSVLQNDLHLKSMYGGSADFSKLFGSSGVSVSTVIHKTFLLIDPIKTEAAAATAILMTRGIIPQVNKMIVDKPFFFAIMDDENKIPLFMGVISDPPQ